MFSLLEDAFLEPMQKGIFIGKYITSIDIKPIDEDGNTIHDSDFPKLEIEYAPTSGAMLKVSAPQPFQSGRGSPSLPDQGSVLAIVKIT